MGDQEKILTYSQNGEDLFIWQLFQSLGFQVFSYLDLGACHPEINSITKLFYDRGCRGINVEPNRYLTELLKKERAEDINVCCGVGIKEGHANFYIFQELSACKTYPIKSRLTLQKENDHHGHQRLESVLVVHVNRLVKTHCKGIWPQFLKCNIEGAEYEVLSSAAWRKSSPIVLCVDVAVSETRSMTNMLWEKGYCPYVRIDKNMIYVRNDYWEILLKDLGIW